MRGIHVINKSCIFVNERNSIKKNIFIEGLIMLIFYLCICVFCVFYSKFLSFANLQRTNSPDGVCLMARHARMAPAISFSAHEPDGLVAMISWT